MDESELPELSLAEVAARLGTPGFHVYDNNGRGRWKRSHVPGAVHLNAYSFEATELPVDRTATLVFYCAGPG
ncbi:MAG: rhodanese-like domain-containing protein [Deltaproteobacteria bacterium]|nr:rhodanese-like domain-containing protein [Deltaproteobacteria bacterium]MDQ3298807.1 rhodanese-like domain-containing protein [Myxococcota bacterium]